MESISITWAVYEFEVLDIDGMWIDVGGIYIFASIEGELWRAYYVGVTDSFQNSPPDLAKWEEAKRLGASHVHARRDSLAASREAIERELIGMYQPPLNV